MSTRLSRITSDIRFFLWKAKTLHAQRYISLVTIIVTVVGLAFVAYRNPDSLIKKAQAANGAVYNGNVLTLDGAGYNYMIMPDALCGGSNASLWPLNYKSSSVMTNGAQANFRGRFCINPSATSLIVTNGAELSTVGSITFSTVTVNGNGSRITTPPADAKGKAVPYPSRKDYFMTRYTGFLQVTNARTYTLRPEPSLSDDALVIEVGSLLNANVDQTTWDVATWNRFGDCGDWDNSFVETTCPGAGAVGLPSTKRNIDYTYSAGSNGYLPIRITTYEHTGKAKYGILYKDNGGGTYLPITSLYGPQTTGANAGLVDSTTPGRMRFEYATVDQGTQSPFLKRDFSNTGSGDGNYAFFASVDMSATGTFSGFGKQNNAFFDFYYDDGNATTINNPLSNAGRADGSAYRLGNLPQNINDQPALLQNYKLQTQGTNASGIAAGLTLAVSGDMSVTAGAAIDGYNKGLPGGVKFYENNNFDRGVSGIGGSSGPVAKTANAKPGWFQAYGNDCGGGPVPGSDWDSTTGNAGGGGGGTQCGVPGSGGGGGGAMGYGSGGRTVDNSDADAIPNAGSTNDSSGGAGYGGRGGSYTRQNVRLDGTSDWSGYTYTSVTGMGGGGATGSDEDGFDMGQGEAGSGGTDITLTIGGNFTLGTSSTITANGGSPSPSLYGLGGGGGGTVDIKVSKDINVDGTSTIKANGGKTIRQPASYPGNTHMKGGEGGGGLVRIGAASFNGAGIPTDYVCQNRGNLFKPTLAGLSVAAGDGQANTRAQHGLIDLYYSGTGTSFCGPQVGGGSDLQVSKQIQQLKSTATRNVSTLALWRAQVDSDASWSNIATVLPGMMIRVVVTVQNPTTVPKNVTLTETMPIKGMTIDQSSVRVAPANGSNSEIAVNVPDAITGAFAIPASGTVSIASLATIRFMYTSLMVDPFK